ncbi:MAG: UDP-N-acetylmuramoyl-L-alanyl-D-glutamate--2,6-diaminopimelate ligase, partial [Huintestinicola sp.]
MNEMKKSLLALLSDAGKAMDYRYKGKDCLVTGITDDTRSIEDGNIFVCVKGQKFDGHTAAEEMLSKGAAVVVCERDLKLGAKQIIVPDTKKFYGLLVAAWFEHPERQLILVGITGTNGKTTMASMIHHILTYAGAMAGLIGTAGTFIGKKSIERDDSTPTTPKVFELYSIFRRMVTEGCRYCVMEVSSFALEQNRIGPAVYTAAVFTNLTRDHLDYHGTMENYYLAKKKLFTDHCKLAFINTEDPFGERLYREISGNKFSYGIKGNTSVYASYIKYVDGASRFWFCFPGKSYPFVLKMMGSYNISNAVAAIAVCLKLNVPMDKITEAVNAFEGVRGRCEIIPTHKDFHIVCDYAHSPDALENMLPAIKENTQGRLICLFGCGGDRDKTKRPLMAKAAARTADYLIVTSDNPRTEDPDRIIDDIVAGLAGENVPYDRITDRREAIFHAVRIAQKGDVIVLAGKGHEDYQILGDVHIHFDEREICAEALRAASAEDVVENAELFSGMTIDEISDAAGGRKENISAARRMINAGSFSSDTRTIHPGSIFVAYKGSNVDGHDFVEEAIGKGAIAAIVNHPVKALPCIVVEDTVRAVLKISGHYRRKFNIKLVGITGSVGKTTTKEMIALALSSKYETLKTEGNHNNEIGMPFTLLGLKPEHKAAVIEMGMSHFGEIERLSE